MNFFIKCSVFKVVLLALLLVAVLQLIYLSLLSRLHGKLQKYKYSELFEVTNLQKGRLQYMKNTKKEHFKYSLATGGMFDASGQYRIYKNLIKSDLASQPDGNSHRSFGLATHTSVNNLHHLRELVERWPHQISVALFATANDVQFATVLIYALSSICPQVREYVTFHLVCHSGVFANFSPDLDHKGEFATLQDCDDAFQKLVSFKVTYQNYAIGNNISYPNNLLRNVARSGLTTKYVLVIDVDTLPSEGLHGDFVSFISHGSSLIEDIWTVFVVPAFEIRHTKKIPATKAELLQLYQVGEVRPFYDELCHKCHLPTNFSRWINLPAASELGVAYSVEWRDPWEPFYIGSRSVPMYDERFKQYGFNRISQACELHVAGYMFSILNNAFLIHKGFKIPSEFHAQKDVENQRNKILFRHFKQDLKLKYPDSHRRC
ncbi:beta-1,4-glucuronyltransferase 1 [Latimeria chalumnae]|uniref:Beta-1,4-glucuronyltransferase 1 n=1 Tax=Latimeria chalumnae TaxID=7897 RepID=H3AK01_LATCH|nr:PREDICTED: beta-1,4-glucuronyltransferase 1 [Latimeria chalumnae]XP_006002512.1 PREDICTED: beta-1,4-glucuronyltransferase 1 [Latimeria chalumnae]|eukprot:XP_006002511.1 PREDICTED: beta-1,4-glucuronyltransferase 1 [Latimeria chalumnae]